ncbi:hypothetical protein JX265_007647 [Neoarthrinium moseri]|uniref:Protein kinase domain-containing protein n=1 Tax=Neoarthrinium moseri TaxID=1658444 RepID=A0A9P9WJV8_9PEZI|nr:hypothetical protein JX265_007647 [Neoarthrinium moseri]
MVMLAKNIDTHEKVALKCVTKKSAANEAGYDIAFDDKTEELFCHRRLGAHPNVVALKDNFETDAHHYLVLEFCQQGDLYEAIRTGHGPISTEHVRGFMMELVDAVSYMHGMGIYHRDIKPENIFLTESGAMKLGDFGLATTEKWSYETAVGSDRYMSPEQYDNDGSGYSPAQADIWAIGIVLLNVLFSRNPFSAPSESDPWFADFSLDKQSLFDVFPTMSQDTYEVICQCMSLDPQKRSLVGAKQALRRVVSFTTEEEEDDEYCCADRQPMATANREPLRTPSIQSPQMDQGAFPWAKALHASPPQAIRQLSAIPDDESYTEELFPKSEGTVDWMSSAQTPSIASVLTSNLGASMNSFNLSPLNIPSRTGAKVSPMAGSLPINMNKPKVSLSAMSMVFGSQKEQQSKSWSDLWEEDEEEDESEHARQVQALKELNSRTWSQDSKENATPTPHDQASDDKPVLSPVHDTFSDDIDGDMVADGFFFHESVVVEQPSPSPERYSPPPKRSDVDRWAALGEKRRAYTNTSEQKRPDLFSKSREPFGLGFTNQHTSPTGLKDYNNYNHHGNKWNKEGNTTRGCPWNKGRDWNWNRREKRQDIGWVGHWQDAH